MVLPAILGGALLGARLLVPKILPSLGRAATGFGRAFVRSPIKTGLLTGATVLGTGALFERPGPTIKRAAEIPRGLFGLGRGAAQVGTGDKSIFDLIKEHPFAAAGVAGAGALGLARVLGPAATGAAILARGDPEITIKNGVDKDTPKTKVEPGVAIAAKPETTSPIVSQPSRLPAPRGARRKKKPSVTNIRQSVRVQVAQSQRNTRINKQVRITNRRR